MARELIVVSYDKNWPQLFAQEASLLTEVFGDELLALHHIGSTAVPGLPAKPVIDILLVVRDIKAVDTMNSGMCALGYECKGEFGIPGRRYFQKGGDQRTHHVHAFQSGSREIIQHLGFRDWLRSHPEVRDAYGVLKRSLAQNHPHDIAAYIHGKEPFIKNSMIAAGLLD